MRRSGHIERLQPLITPDPVINMDHQIARRQGRGLSQEVLGAPSLIGPGQTVAENVGLGNDRQAVGLKSGVERQHNPLWALGVGGLCGLPIGGKDEVQAMIGQHSAQTLGRAFGPRGEQDPLALTGQHIGVIGGGLEQIDTIERPLCRKAPPLPRAHIDLFPALLLERREPA